MTFYRYNLHGKMTLFENISPNSTRITCDGKNIIVKMNSELLKQRWYNWQQMGQPAEKAFDGLSLYERAFVTTGYYSFPELGRKEK